MGCCSGRGVAQPCTASEDAVLWAVGCFAVSRVQVRVLSGWEGIRLNYTGSGGNLVRAYLGLFLSQSAFKMLLKLLLVFSRDTLIERVERNGVSSVHLETQLGQDWLEESTVPQGRCCRVAGGRMPRPFLCAHPPQPPLSALLLGKEHSGLLSCSMIFSFEVFSSTVRAFLRTEELWGGGGAASERGAGCRPSAGRSMRSPSNPGGFRTSPPRASQPVHFRTGLPTGVLPVP